MIVLLDSGTARLDLEAARAEPLHRSHRPRVGRQDQRAACACRCSSSSGRSLDGCTTTAAVRPRCGTPGPGSWPSWSASSCSPPPGWLRACIGAGWSATGRLVAGAASWLAVVLAVYAVLVWFVSTPLVPRYFLALVAILAVPLVRLSAAPLALAWNRHRVTRDARTGVEDSLEGRPMALRVVVVLLGLPRGAGPGRGRVLRRPNRNNGALVSSGEEREYLLHVPKSYDPAGRRRSSSAFTAGRAGRPCRRTRAGGTPSPRARGSSWSTRRGRAAEGPGPGT